MVVQHECSIYGHGTGIIGWDAGRAGGEYGQRLQRLP